MTQGRRNFLLGTPCTVEGCDKPIRWLNVCAIHYHRMKQFGRYHTIKRKDGEGSIQQTGYKLITTPDGQRTLEHIYLAEKALGKPLPRKAVVHHMNEDKLDNHTPFNLVVCPDQAYHMLLHKRTRDLGYAKQIANVVVPTLEELMTR